MSRRRILMAKSRVPFKYVSGAKLLCSNGNAFNNYYNGAASLGVEVTFMVTDNTSWHTIVYNLFKSSSGKEQGWDIYTQNGILYFRECFNGTFSQCQWTNWNIKRNTWYHLNMYATNSGIYMSIDDSTYVVKTIQNRNQSAFSTARSISFGNSGGTVSFRGVVYVRGTSYNDAGTNNVASWNIEDATVGSSLSLKSANGLYTLTGGTVHQAIDQP